MAARDLRLRGHHLHRRPGPGGGAGAGAPQGGAAGHQAGKHLHRGPARGLRARLRHADVPRQRALRGRLSAGHLHRPAADRQAADRDRGADRRGCRGPRGHRQGQRPGPLRVELLRPRSRYPRDRPLARMGPDQPYQADRLRRTASDSHRQGQARGGALQRRRQPAAHLRRGKDPGGSLGGAGRACLLPQRRAGGGARPSDLRGDRLRTRRSSGGRRRASFTGGLADSLERTGRRQRHRPGGYGGGALRRHEVARDLRDARRHDLAGGAPGDRVHHPGSRRAAPEGRADAALCRADLQRLLVQSGTGDAAGRHRP